MFLLIYLKVLCCLHRFIFLSGSMFMIDELGKIWKEAVVVYLHINKFIMQGANYCATFLVLQHM
jgi:hypothetical protein